MTARFATLTKPATNADFRGLTGHRRIGLALAVAGLMLAGLTLVANLVASDVAASGSLSILRWSFGLTTLAFGTIKLGIAIVLVGILIRLWHRVDSVRAAFAALQPDGGGGTIQKGATKTAFGAATVDTTTPRPLPIHKMARKMWLPMLAMGAMALAIGTVISFAWSGDESNVALSAWTQGSQFLGEAMLLAGISLLLGTILAALREGGGSVQEALGLKVVTLRMPSTAKIFVALMMVGLMLGVLQFALYVVVAGGVDTPAAWFAWLGPVRELSLGLLLAGIVMALVTIGNVLGFQFARLREIATTGQ